MKDLKIALIPLARVNYDMDLAQKLANEFRTHLILRGLRVVGKADLVTDLAQAEAAIQQLAGKEYDLLLVFQATFADSTLVASLARAIDIPIFLWAVPEERTGGRLRLNSLCGVNLAAHALTLQHRQYDYAYAQPNDRDATDHLRAVTAAAQVVRRLKSARIGVVGEHPAGMDTCFLDEAELNARLGVQIVPISLQTVFDRVRQLEPEVVTGVHRRLERRVSRLDEVDQPQLHRSLGAYHVLREIAYQEKLDGLAIRCWPEFFTDLQCSACGAMSMLSDEQIPCGCEADINGTLSQLVLQWLSEMPAFGTDIVSSDYEGDTTVLWHCGQAPLSMADSSCPPQATIHSNRRLPLLMEFPLKPGRVTFARLSRASGELRLVVSRGEMLSAPPSFSGTSGVARFERPARQVLDTILREGLEHHISLTYGDHFSSLLALARMLCLPVLTL